MDNKRINVVSQSCANLALKTLSVIAKNNAIHCVEVCYMNQWYQKA